MATFNGNDLKEAARIIAKSFNGDGPGDDDKRGSNEELALGQIAATLEVVERYYDLKVKEKEHELRNKGIRF